VRRKLLNFATAVSLVLLVAAVGLWVRSAATADFVHWKSDSHCFTLGAYRGKLTVTRWDRAEHDPKGMPWHETDAVTHFDDVWPRYVSETTWNFLGFRVILRMRNMPSIVMMVLPLPVLALILAVCPVWRLVQLMRRRRYIASGGCAVCGYDLTGNISGVCPECGTPMTGKAGGD
jgi:hypothetical protein